MRVTKGGLRFLGVCFSPLPPSPKGGSEKRDLEKISLLSVLKVTFEVVIWYDPPFRIPLWHWGTVRK